MYVLLNVVGGLGISDPLVCTFSDSGIFYSSMAFYPHFFSEHTQDGASKSCFYVELY